MKKYNSVGHIAFTVEHDTEDPYESLNIDHIRKRLLSRIIDLTNTAGGDALYFFDDTVEGSLMKTEQIAPSFWQVTVNHQHTKLVFFSNTAASRQL